MKTNKIMKAFLMLVAAFLITIGMTGCGSSSSLPDSQVIKKIEDLSTGIYERSKLGHNVEVHSINGHTGSAAIWYYNLFASGKERLPSCDELWVAEIHSDKWENRVVRLCRRGSHYFLHWFD